jgi:hypothetical protein
VELVAQELGSQHDEPATANTQEDSFDEIPRSSVRTCAWYGGSRRLLLTGIGVLMALTFARGLFWVVTFPVWYGDEGAQFSYEQSVATGKGIPVAGKSLNSADTLRLIKASPVAIERTMPLPASPTLQWGIVDEQYEGLQSPLYYLALAPVYWVGRAGGGELGAFYALRLASLCLAVAAIPLTALLARALLPDRRAVWLLAPAVICVLQIVNVQNSYVDNDSSTMVVAALCLLALLACRGDLRARRSILFGASLAIALLAKATLAALLPAILIAMVAYAVRRRPGIRTAACWVAAAGGTFFILVLPFLLFNEVEYHALSGARSAAALIKPVIGSTPVSLAGARELTGTFLRTLFVGQDLVPQNLTDPYRHLWDWTAVVTATAAFVGATVRGRWDEFKVIAWIVVSIPLGLVLLIAVGFDQSGSQATVVGRYLDCFLPLFAVMVGYGAVIALGARLGSVALLAIFVTGSFLEVSGDRAWVTSTYTAGVIGRTVPALEQSYADGSASLSGMQALIRCPATTIALSSDGPPPVTITVNGRPSAARATNGLWTEYPLAQSAEGRVAIRFVQPVRLAVARHLASFAEPAGSVANSRSGVPAIRIYCPAHGNAANARFSQLYPANHPPLSFGTLLAWPEAEAWAEVVLAAGVAVLLAWNTISTPTAHHRRRSHVPRT